MANTSSRLAVSELDFDTIKQNLKDYMSAQSEFSDYDLLLRFIRLNKLKYLYLPKVFVKMKLGGISNNNLFSIIRLNREIYIIHKDNDLPISIINLFRKIRFLFNVKALTLRE